MVARHLATLLDRGFLARESSARYTCVICRELGKRLQGGGALTSRVLLPCTQIDALLLSKTDAVRANALTIQQRGERIANRDAAPSLSNRRSVVVEDRRSLG